MPETIHEYARERLADSSEAEAIRRVFLRTGGTRRAGAAAGRALSLVATAGTGSAQCTGSFLVGSGILTDS
jgi:hypothetical protein